MTSAQDMKLVVLGRFKPLCFLDSDTLLVYRRGRLCYYSISSQTTSLASRVPASAAILASHIRLAERAMRTEPRTAVALDGNTVLVSLGGSIYRLTRGTGELVAEHKYAQGVNNPLALGEVKAVPGFRDSIVYGEYWGNPSRRPVAIWVRDSERAVWETKFEFPARTIKHVHGIIPDAEHARLLVLTGDSDHESGIWAAYEGFSRVEPLAAGSQKYRTCCAFPVDDGLLYATDSPTTDNYIYFAKDFSTPVPLYALDGPCIYATAVGEKYLFATSVEGDSSIGGLRYLLTTKIGPGVKSRNLSLVMGNVSRGFSRTLELRKDWWPYALFGFGSFCFPTGAQHEDRMVLYVVAARGHDGETLMLSAV